MKCLCRIVRRIKAPKNLQISQGVCPCEANLYEKVAIFDTLGRIPTLPPAPIEVKFCTPKWTQVPVGPAKFDVNRCNESHPQGEKPDFWPASKFNTGSLLLRCNPAGKNTIYT